MNNIVLTKSLNSSKNFDQTKQTTNTFVFLNYSLYQQKVVLLSGCPQVFLTFSETSIEVALIYNAENSRKVPKII